MMLNSQFSHEFSGMFDNAGIGILVVNINGEIEAANKYALDEFGYTAGELLHQKAEVLMPDGIREKHKLLREEFCHKPEQIETVPGGNKRGLRKDGSQFPVELSLGFFRGRAGIYFVVFVNDISKKLEADESIRQLKAELDQRVKESTRSLHATVEQLSRQIKENERKDAELLKALEKEKELNQLKSRFVSIASHEFRTPLSGILASTYLLAKYTKESDQAQRDKHIRRIISSANILNEVLGDFLSVDKMEQDNFKPNRTVFDIDEVVGEVMQATQHLLKPGQHISYRHSGVKDFVYLDHSMFNHILGNLLSNAIKYSPENSEIELSVMLKAQKLTVRVKDHGIGIPQKEQSELFKRFFRSSNAAHIQGTGLGLNIVKKYVDVLDGTIECISAENAGTEFIVRFKNQKEVYEDHIGSRRQ